MRRQVWKRRLQRGLIVLGLLVWTTFIGLYLLAFSAPLPEALIDAPAAGAGGAGPVGYDASVRIVDRHGVALHEVRLGGHERAQWVSLAEVGSHVPKAMLAAEDKRFYSHLGIDPIATTRAAGQAVLHGRVVGGASTLSQQLARVLTDTPRTVSGKLEVLGLALRIERDLTKDQILEQYLNEVSFAVGTRGIEAASQHLFGKPTRELSLAEAAALCSMPRGPWLYDPHRGTERLQRRRDRVLDRMFDAGWISEAQRRTAQAEPFALRGPGVGLGAPHFVRALMQNKLIPGLASGPLATVHTSLDAGLQREVSGLTRQVVQGLAEHRASSAAVIVLHNETGEILSYVGSHNLLDEAGLGHNDGVLARRQPGSTLKPFVYGLAMDRLGWSPTTLLPDVELHFPSETGDYHPKNYDRRFHGPVRLREALANSYNVPAVWTADVIGVPSVLQSLNQAGLDLTESAGHYGVAIALGDAEVRLLDLANAYASLARGGTWRPVRPVMSAYRPGGQPVSITTQAERPLMSPQAAYLLTHILSDDTARIGAFGRGGPLELSYPVAAKTGTSKGFRDNLTVGYTPAVTVAVWVGNFDGSPMQGISGVTGAGPLFRSVMEAASRRYPGGDFLTPENIGPVTVCALSGDLAGPDCPHRVADLRKTAATEHRCELHQVIRLTEGGERAGPACALPTTEQVVEVYPAEFASWARQAGRPIPPPYAAACPGAAVEDRLAVVFPTPGATFSIDPAASSPSTIVIDVAAVDSPGALVVLIDGTPHPAPQGRFTYELTPGEHSVIAVRGEARSERVVFTVH